MVLAVILYCEHKACLVICDVVTGGVVGFVLITEAKSTGA